MIRTPPSEFVRDLTAYDPDLRARWAFRLGVWFIERKVSEQLAQRLGGRPNPWKSRRGHDLYDGWREGYIHVLTVGPDDLTWRFVVEYLRFADLRAHDRLQDVNRKLDALIEAEERAQDRTVANWLEDATSEAYHRLQWLQGNRVALRTPAGPAVEQRDGFVVRDRRRVTV